jgi:ATP-binding cassette, subfamily C (CFTR/MRP), member 1
MSAAETFPLLAAQGGTVEAVSSEAAGHHVPEKTAPHLVKSKLEFLLSQLTFHWFTPILRLGNQKRRLDPEDLHIVELPTTCTTDDVASRFGRHWQDELLKQSQGVSPSLLRALFRAFGGEFIQAGFFKLIHDLCIFVGPQVLHAMIVFLRDPAAPWYLGLIYTAVVTASQVCMSFCLRQYFFKCFKVDLRVRTAIVSAVYGKALKLDASERQSRTLGEINNLMSVDTETIQGTKLPTTACFLVFAYR